jgi:hypothetical protein
MVIIYKVKHVYTKVHNWFLCFIFCSNVNLINVTHKACFRTEQPQKEVTLQIRYMKYKIVCIQCYHSYRT